jgi:His-Xaa-Ser system protein HxsD
MSLLKFRRELYSKVALLKAAYQYTDKAYLHLDADENYYYVECIPKSGCCEISENAFKNEMLAQSLRHEIYLQTKNIRELLIARALSTSLIAETNDNSNIINSSAGDTEFSEDEILKDWFEKNDNGTL